MSQKFNTALDRIKNISEKKGVTIILDYNENSDLVQIDSLYSYDSKNKILKIFAPELGKKNKELLFKLIRKTFNEGGLIWKSTKSEALNSYNDYTTHNKDQKILDFFRPILNNNDFSALKMSLFLRVQSEMGKDINMYKAEIRNKFDDRGANIANLCSAGYFENEFEKLYMTVPKTEFHEYYEMVVGAKARALFVNVHMTVNQIEKEVNEMVEKAIKYHMDDFRLHGKGKTNVTRIEKFVKLRTDKDGYKIEKVYDDPKLSAVEYLVKIIREK